MSIERPVSFPQPSQETHKNREDLLQNIQRLLASSIPIERVAELLGAEKYMSQTAVRSRRAGRVASLNIKEFVDDLHPESSATPLILPTEMHILAQTILPPDAGELRTGNGRGIEEKKFIPRSRFLMELLSELKLEYSVVEGVNEPKMMRSLSYKAFIIPQLKKLVLLNNEEGNATFIVHQVQEEWESLLRLRKSELKALEDNGEVSTIIYQNDSEKWKARIQELLFRSPELSRPEEKPKEEGEKRVRRIEAGVQYPLAPEGWATWYEVAKTLGRSWSTVKKLGESYESEHPEWFGIYRNRVTRKDPAVYISLVLQNVLYEKFKEVEKAPEGWITRQALVKETNKDPRWMDDRIERNRSSHPEWTKKYLTSENYPAVHFHPDFVAEIRKEVAEEKKAPEGWKTAYDLVDELGRAHIWVQARIKKYSSDHPDWIKEYLTERNHKVKHLHPDLIEKIRLESEGDQKAPQGWIGMRKLAEELERAPGWMEPRIARYTKNNPHWAKEYIGEENYKAMHLHPELVAKIRQEVEEDKKPPAGWVTRQNLANELGKTLGWVEVVMKKWTPNHPEWVREYLAKNERRTSHLHPELVQKIRMKAKELEETTTTPEGWEVKTSLSLKLGKSGNWIEKHVDSHREGKPEWFHDYLDKGKRLQEYFHPELIRELEKKKEQYEAAPLGWKTRRGVARMLSKRPDQLKKKIDEKKEIYPEEFRLYLDSTPKVVEHLSPTIIEKIQRELEESEGS